MANNDARFELKISTERREALDSLARQSGVSSSDLVRLAINQLLEDRDVRLGASHAA
jgi:predicted DNA-binding protein